MITFRLVFVAIALLAFADPSFAESGKSIEYRILAETKLSNARKEFELGARFNNFDLRTAFQRGSSNIAAVLLELERQGGELTRIVLYVNYDGQTMVSHVVDLPRNSPDFELLKAWLGIN